ncbi:MAG: AsmA family protein [Geminicoccaceae bacterium]
MRGVLVLIGLLTGLVVAFLAAWPQLVDVPELREQLAGMLRDAGGGDLRLEGAVRLEMLPRPRITIERAVIGDRVAVGPGPRFAADRIDLDLALLPLLAGRIEPRGVQLVRPELDLDTLDGIRAERLAGTLAAGPFAAFGRIEVVDGTIEVTTPKLTLSAIDLRVSRASDALQAAGSLAAGGVPLRLELSGAPPALGEPVPLRIEAEIGPQAHTIQAAFAGHARLDTAGSTARGRLTVDAPRGFPDWLGAGPWPAAKLQAQLAVARGSLQLDELLATLPEGELRGKAEIASLSPLRLDIGLDGASIAMSPALTTAAARLLRSARDAPASSGTIRLELASVTWRGDQLRRIRCDAAWSPQGFDLRQLDAVLPGQTELRWAGQGPAGPGAPVAGRLAVQSGELRGLLAWLGADMAMLPGGGLSSLDLAAHADVEDDRLELSGLQARLDASKLDGTVAFTSAPRPRLDLRLAVDRVNGALYAPWPRDLADWRAGLEALDGSVALQIGQVSHDMLRGRELSVRATLEAGKLGLDSLHLADLAGAGLDAHGTLDLPLGAWDVEAALALAQAKPALRLLGIDAPLGLDSLAPLRLTAATRREAGVTSLDASLAGRGASASLRGSLDGAVADGALQLDLTADAASAGDLLQALGWPAPAEPVDFGAMSAQVTVARHQAPIEASLAATLGSDQVAGKVSLVTTGERPRLAGELTAATLDTRLGAALYETLALPLGVPPGDPWLWPGIWPRRALDWSWLTAIDVDLVAAAREVRRGGTELGAAEFEVRWSDGNLGLRNVRLPLAGGVLTGNATLEGRGDHVVAGAELRLGDAQLAALAASSAPGSTLSGRLGLQASLLGQGRGIADIVGSLAGDGAVELTDAVLPDAKLPLTPADKLRDFRLAGAFSVQDGVLAAPNLALQAIDGQADVDLRLDLLAWMLEARLRQDGKELRFVGPPGRTTAATNDAGAP